MTTHRRLAHPWKVARITATALALSAAAFGVSGSAGATPASTTTARTTGATTTAVAAPAPCLGKASAQRVRAGSDLDGVDPNTLTLAQTRKAEAKVAARARQRGVDTRRSSLPPTKVDVYVHVITRKSGSGSVSTSRIKKQISVLNKAYAGETSDSSTNTGFSFRLKDVDKTKNSDWYHWAAPTDDDPGDDVPAKTALHRGGPDDLNLYLAALDDDVLGYSSFPWDTTLAEDGVVVLNASLPGGNADDYDKGDTAVHEVGHWLGLLHTFQNGCTSPGDLVADTPAQADGGNIFSCSTKLDTCAGKGKDPVHNFMSYGDDTCLDRFTPGQALRMASAWALFRDPTTAG